MPAELLQGRRRAASTRVLAELAASGAASRADLARATGLAPSTVTSLVAALMEEGLVRPADVAGPAGVGRPGQLIRLDRGAGAVLGVDLGRHHLKVAVADLSHTLLARTETVKSIAQDSAADLGMVKEYVAATLDEAGVAAPEVLAVGVGLPGPVHTSGELGDSTILPGWVGVKASEAFEEALGLGVEVDNDANLGALGEWRWGAGAQVRDLVYLKVSTGVGAGLVVDGRLYRGAGHTAGEIGHTVLDPGGPVCRCGNRGCLEMYAGSGAILSALQASHPELSDLGAVVERALDGDAGCRRVVADAGRAIGTALAAVCNILNPARVVVGGTLGGAGDVLLDQMREAVHDGSIRSASMDVEIVPAGLGADSELMGAVALALAQVEARLKGGRLDIGVLGT